MAGYLAYIIPVDQSLHPDNTLPTPQPPGNVGIWPGPHPSHPIMLPGMPGWGSGGARPPVDPGYSPPWAQVPPGGQPPLGIWGPPGPWPTPPIYIPITPPEGSPHPEHPIYIPVDPSGPPPNMEEIKKKLEFWLGNLPPPPPTPPTPTPV